MREVDPATWQVDAPAGYHAVAWSDAAPEELLVSYARALNAIHDAPDGTAEFEFPQWTAESVRAEEARLAASGMTQWTVAAVRDADNEVAGYTEVLLRPWLANIAVVGNTAVLEQHRGHRLGVFVKARMSAWLHEEQPAREWVMTMTNADNEHMIRVNERIGFTTTRTVVVLNAELDALTGGQTAQQHLEQ
jgi:RimJ/RimL family protein N-acetyltransferase